MEPIGSIILAADAKSNRQGKISVKTRILKNETLQCFFLKNLSFTIPQEIKNEPDTPKAVQWMQSARITLSVKLEHEQPVYDHGSLFHVYFTTDESSGVGFTIHGDFYLEPNRKRLMSGKYNEWLMQCAAKEAANQFLSALLEQFKPVDVYEALSPTNNQANAAVNFISLFSYELKARQTPFVFTRGGMLTQTEVVMPPSIDSEGFWDAHFGDSIELVETGKKAFLSPEADTQKARSFLQLTNIKFLKPELFIDLMERASLIERPISWWIECYSFLANDEKLSKYGHSFYQGRKLILVSDNKVIEVPKDQETTLVCLPPTKNMYGLTVPNLFSEVFVFLHPELAEHLLEASDTIRSWILDRFRISKFEASDFLQRAIRGVVNKIFSGERKIFIKELREMWLFVKKTIDLSRSNLSEDFWSDIGRLPLPIEVRSKNDYVDPKYLAPAFLCYLPDGFTAANNNCLTGIEGLRRIDKDFLLSLIRDNEQPESNWIAFLKNVGVSTTPKVLKYVRMVGKGQEIPFIADSIAQIALQPFTGDRQLDENKAVINILRDEGLWNSIVKNISDCGHSGEKVLQSLSVLEGFSLSVKKAEEEYNPDEKIWANRLWSLIQQLSILLTDKVNSDKVFCHGGKPGGHQIEIKSYIDNQFEYFNWLPTSHGPMGKSQSFARLHSRHFISTGTANEILGDVLLPYVVAPDIVTLSRLEKLGVQILEDAESASTTSLIKALKRIGEILSSEWGNINILAARNRWRLVRGAIQEAYKVLNQKEQNIDWDRDILLPTRGLGGVIFQAGPCFYAQPGSAMERAFVDILPLIDADRPYAKLFEKIGIERLLPGENVHEELVGSEKAIPHEELYNEIYDKLSPYLLSMVIAKSDKVKHTELVVRRLKERFQVKVMKEINVSFSLINNPYASRKLSFHKFYLKKETLEARGPIEEAHYVLFVAGDQNISLFSVDPDVCGESVAPVFLDGISDELTAIFPRIVSRYQQVGRAEQEMQEYLYKQFGISKEIQEAAFTLLSGEAVELSEILAPPPPKIIIDTMINTAQLGAKANFAERIDHHQKEINHKVNDLLNTFKQSRTTGSTTGSSGGPSPTAQRVTPEQEKRGKKGEEEMKRRLMLPGGWEGFVFLEDKRTFNCGYDFLCKFGEKEIEVEVKTFSENGRIIVTSNELQEAAITGNDYYLVGMLDCEKTPYEWPTFIIKNPINLLLTKGEFDIEAKLEVSASELMEK